MTFKNNLDVFEKIAAQKQQSAAPRPQIARFSGPVLGGLVGLSYGLVVMYLPVMLMPGVPLARPPFGAWGNLLAAVIIGAILGTVTVLPASGVVGAFLATGLLWTLLAVRAGLAGMVPLSPFMNQAVGMYLFLMAMALGAVGTPYFLALRRAAERQSELWHRPWWDSSRILLPVILMLLAAGAAAFSLPSARVQAGMLRMNTLLREGRQAPGALRGPLSDARVQDFAAHAGLPYTLEDSPDEALRSDLAPIVAPLDVVITAVFIDGYRVSCMFKDGIDIVICKSFP